MPSIWVGVWPTTWSAANPAAADLRSEPHTPPHTGTGELMSAYTPAVLGEDLAVATLAGYLGTKAMEPISTKLYELESEANRAREDTARPGAPYRIAADKLTRLVGLHLSEQQLDRAALGFHYGLAISWAPLYGLL